MANSVFVDTWGWYALIDRREPEHGEVVGIVEKLIQDGFRLVSTDYVLDESCTLAKARAGSLAAIRLLDLVDRTAVLDLEWIGSDRFDRAKATFRKQQDQAYSFTDCTSFTVMRDRRITDVITMDDHFRIAGFRTLPKRSTSPIRLRT